MDDVAFLDANKVIRQIDVANSQTGEFPLAP
jgi:hypothetical protein